MILLALMLAQSVAGAGGYDPEIEALMRRRKPAEKPVPTPSPSQGQARDEAQSLAAILPPDVAKRLDACIARANVKPEDGIADARGWIANEGGAPAAQCLGYALGQSGKWSEAADALESGAALAGNDAVTRARLYAQAGNAALVGGNARRAVTVLDAALASPLPATLATGEIHLDRARARVAVEDLPGARVDLDKAVQLAAADPLAWLLSATLARRMNDLPLARLHIAEAVKRARDDAGVALEEGVILALSGDRDEGARAAFSRAAELAPGSDIARKAQAYLAQLGPVATPAKAKAETPR